MSPRKEGETPEMYMYRLERTQEEQEREMNRLASRVNSVEAVAIEAREMAMQTNAMIELMPQRVIEAIEAKNRTKSMDLRDWLVVLAGIGGTITAIVVAVVK